MAYITRSYSDDFEDHCEKKKNHCKDKHEDKCKCHCDDKHEDKCKNHCEDKEIAGVVTSGSLLTLAVTGSPIPLPLNSPVLITEYIQVAPTGGLIVQEDGDYLVQFTASVLTVSATGSLSVFADSRFLGNTSPLSVLGLANFAAIVRLRKGDLVQVVANGPIAAGVLSQGTLTVARLEE